MQALIPSHLDASAQLLFAEAVSRGIDCKTFPGSQIIYMTYQGQSWYTSGSRTSFQSAIGQTIADNKAISKIFLKVAQAPTAKSVLIKNLTDLPLLNQLSFPVVAKPIKGSHGDGVKTDLIDAMAVSKLISQNNQPLLVEETLAGTEFRIICIDFKFIAAAYRKAAHIIGDGQKTIFELIAIKNQHPWRESGHHGKLTTIVIDQPMTELLSAQNLSLESILAQNQELLLKKTANLSTGGEAWDVSADVGVENRQLFENIAKTADLNVIGIDVMCRNLTQPIVNQSQAGIIEINKSPGLRMHHFPIKGQPQNIAKLIIDLAIRKAAKL